MDYDQHILDLFGYFFVGSEFLARHNYIMICLPVCVRNPTLLLSSDALQRGSSQPQTRDYRTQPLNIRKRNLGRFYCEATISSAGELHGYTFFRCERINKLRDWTVSAFTPPIALVPSRSGSHNVAKLNSHDPVALSRLAEQSISALIRS